MNKDRSARHTSYSNSELYLIVAKASTAQNHLFVLGTKILLPLRMHVGIEF